jgi:hypothetical protein
VSAPRIANLLIIGAQKCGTTSLHEYLDAHPAISMSEEKEPNFFSWHFERGVDWYGRLWSEDAQVLGESSTNYTAHPVFPGVPERIRAVAPDARLIYLVRDPVDRMVSHYAHGYLTGLFHKPADELLRNPEIGETDLVWRGQYAMQLERFLEHFPAEQILVIDQRDLLRERRETLRRVFAFAGVDEHFWTPEFEVRHFESDKSWRPRGVLSRSRRLNAAVLSTYDLPRPFGGAARRLLARPVSKPRVDAGLRSRLAEHFRADAARLRELTGLKLGHWSV